MLASYDAVIAAQEEVNIIVKPLGGECDGWGTFGNGDVKKPEKGGDP